MQKDAMHLSSDGLRKRMTSYLSKLGVKWTPDELFGKLSCTSALEEPIMGEFMLGPRQCLLCWRLVQQKVQIVVRAAHTI